MSLDIVEWFGHGIGVDTAEATAARRDELCPFIGRLCTKSFNDGSRSGVCSVKQKTSLSPIVVCPNRLYADSYAILRDVAAIAFGAGCTIIHPDHLKTTDHDGRKIVAFGKHFGKELKLPRHGGRGGYFVDWILARISPSGDLAEFVAVEVQTIDTTGTYRPEVQQLRQGSRSVGTSEAGLNWENVSKRILPQLIYKGHVLRREKLCTKGLFFITPTEVYQRVVGRLGNTLLDYTNLQPGSITFLWYGLDTQPDGRLPLHRNGQFSTTVDQVALAFTSPSNLPEAGVYETAIRRELA